MALILRSMEIKALVFCEERLLNIQRISRIKCLLPDNHNLCKGQAATVALVLAALPSGTDGRLAASSQSSATAARAAAV